MMGSAALPQRLQQVYLVLFARLLEGLGGMVGPLVGLVGTAELVASRLTVLVLGLGVMEGDQVAGLDGPRGRMIDGFDKALGRAGLANEAVFASGAPASLDVRKAGSRPLFALLHDGQGSQDINKSLDGF